MFSTDKALQVGILKHVLYRIILYIGHIVVCSMWASLVSRNATTPFRGSWQRWVVEEEEEEEEEDLFVFNDTIEGPRAPEVRPILRLECVL
jgi:hypothetical protein